MALGAILPGDTGGLEGDLLLHRLALYRLVFWFVFYFLILYWIAVYYQCCDSFRWTTEGLSHMYARIHSPSDSPPIQAAT